MLIWCCSICCLKAAFTLLSWVNLSSPASPQFSTCTGVSQNGNSAHCRDLVPILKPKSSLTNTFWRVKKLVLRWQGLLSEPRVLFAPMCLPVSAVGSSLLGELDDWGEKRPCAAHSSHPTNAATLKIKGRAKCFLSAPVSFFSSLRHSDLSPVWLLSWGSFWSGTTGSEQSQRLLGQCSTDTGQHLLFSLRFFWNLNEQTETIAG